MGESAADVMRKLRQMKEAKAAKARTAGPPSSGKRKATESADEVMEKLRRLKANKPSNSGNKDLGNNGVRKGADSLRIVNPDDEDDSADDEDIEDYDRSDDSDSADDEDEEFAGFDDGAVHNADADDSDEGPVIVRFDGSKTEAMTTAPTPRDRKNFMSPKAPKSDIVLEKESNKNKKNRTAPKDDEDDQINLKHDVELQRLITESHILSEASRKGGAISLSEVSFEPIGKARLKTMESRIESLALRGNGRRNAAEKDYFSVNPQALIESQKKKFNKEKMPMSMRKGMINKKAERKRKYEANAKEAGIVLPKAPRKDKKSRGTTRDRGLKIQSVGRFTKAGLTLSKSEIARHGKR